MLFEALVAVHVLIWAFVLGAWVHPRAAAVNLLLVIPAIYVIHALAPFHVLEAAKAHMRPDSWKRDNDDLLDAWVLPGMLKRVQLFLETRCFLSPLSPQGMLVLGALTSSWTLMRHGLTGP